MHPAVTISGSGHHIAPECITNEELCKTFNTYVQQTNEINKDAIERGDIQPLPESSPAFILQASGIKQRYVLAAKGILDPDIMQPIIPRRCDDELSLQCEFGLHAAKKALKAAKRTGEDIDLIILAASNLQRMYPGIAMELQAELKAPGAAYDMVVGCSSASFAIQAACSAIQTGAAKRALIVNPEIMSPQISWRNRDSHFLFGDVSTALVLERADESEAAQPFDIVGIKLFSKFSSNIRNNAGFLNASDPEDTSLKDKRFYQQGRRVFKDICPLVPAFIKEHLEELNLTVSDINRFWLHQANLNINMLIANACSTESQQSRKLLSHWTNLGI